MLSANRRVHDGRPHKGASLENPLDPFMPGWRGASPRPEGPSVWQQNNVGVVRQQVGLAPQALRVKEHAAQTLRVQEAALRAGGECSQGKEHRMINQGRRRCLISVQFDSAKLSTQALMGCVALAKNSAADVV